MADSRPADGLAELQSKLRGGAAEREEAFAELLRREARHDEHVARSGSAATREELGSHKLMALRARSLELELDEADIEAAMDEADPKAGMIELLMAQTDPRAQEFKDIAVGCAAPFCELLCKSASEVGPDEYRRAAQVFTALSGVDPGRVGGECNKMDQCNIYHAWRSPDSAFGVVLAKEPQSLTSNDALLLAMAM